MKPTGTEKATLEGLHAISNLALYFDCGPVLNPWAELVAPMSMLVHEWRRIYEGSLNEIDQWLFIAHTLRLGLLFRCITDQVIKSPVGDDKKLEVECVGSRWELELSPRPILGKPVGAHYVSRYLVTSLNRRHTGKDSGHSEPDFTGNYNISRPRTQCASKAVGAAMLLQRARYAGLV